MHYTSGWATGPSGACRMNRGGRNDSPADPTTTQANRPDWPSIGSDRPGGLTRGRAQHSPPGE